MSTRTNTPSAQNCSIILSSAARIQEIYVTAEKRRAPEPIDPTETEEAEIHALTSAIFASTPRTKKEAAAVYRLALEQLECAADNVATFDAATLHRAFKSAQPFFAAA